MRIDIPEAYNKILIQHSGGVDSTYVIYGVVKTLVEEKRNVQVIINTGFEPKTDPHSFERTDKICKKIFEHFNYTNYIHIKFEYKEGLIDSKQRQFSKSITDVYDKYKIDAVYRGITKAPPVYIQELACGYIIEGRTFDKAVSTVDWNPHGFYNHRPIINIDKKELAVEWNKSQFLVDEIYKMTFSCVSGMHYTAAWTKHCLSCWWCGERMWAFGKII